MLIVPDYFEQSGCFEFLNREARPFEASVLGLDSEPQGRYAAT